MADDDDDDTGRHIIIIIIIIITRWDEIIPTRRENITESRPLHLLKTTNFHRILNRNNFRCVICRQSSSFHLLCWYAWEWYKSVPIPSLWVNLRKGYTEIEKANSLSPGKGVRISMGLVPLLHEKKPSYWNHSSLHGTLCSKRSLQK